MYVNNMEPEMFLPPGSESFNHNATRTTSSRSRSNNVNNNIVPVYIEWCNILKPQANHSHFFWLYSVCSELLKYSLMNTGLNSLMVRDRVSASGTGGSGFDPGPCHTKHIKDGASGYLAWCSAFIRQALASLLQKI